MPLDRATIKTTTTKSKMITTTMMPTTGPDPIGSRMEKMMRFINTPVFSNLCIGISHVNFSIFNDVGKVGPSSSSSWQRRDQEVGYKGILTTSFQTTCKSGSARFASRRGTRKSRRGFYSRSTRLMLVVCLLNWTRAKESSGCPCSVYDRIRTSLVVARWDRNVRFSDTSRASITRRSLVTGLSQHISNFRRRKLHFSFLMLVMKDKQRSQTLPRATNGSWKWC